MGGGAARLSTATFYLDVNKISLTLKAQSLVVGGDDCPCLLGDGCLSGILCHLISVGSRSSSRSLVLLVCKRVEKASLGTLPSK